MLCFPPVLLYGAADKSTVPYTTRSFFRFGIALQRVVCYIVFAVFLLECQRISLHRLTASPCSLLLSSATWPSSFTEPSYDVHAKYGTCATLPFFSFCFSVHRSPEDLFPVWQTRMPVQRTRRESRNIFHLSDRGRRQNPEPCGCRAWVPS